jgi:hypothetical protein
MSTATGRAIIGTFVAWLLIGYPVQNTIENTQQLSMSVSCSSHVLRAQADNMKLVFLEFQLELTKKLLAYVNNILEPINNTVAFFDKQLSVHESNFEEVRESIAWAKKQCEDEIGKVSSGCNSRASAIFKDCKNLFSKVSMLDFFCQPVKLGGQVCSGIEDVSVCSIFQPFLAVENLLPVLRRELRTAFRTLDFEYNQTKSVNMKSNTEEVFREFKHSLNSDVENAMKRVSFVFLVAHYVIGALTFLALPFSANLYLRKYLLSNKYGGHPDRYGCCGSFSEGKRRTVCITLKVCFWLGKMLLTAFVFCVEYLIYWITTTVIQNSDLNLLFNGTLDFVNAIEGDHFVFNLMRSIYPEISIHQKFNFSINPIECVPKLTPLSGIEVYLTAVGLYAILLVLTCISPCVLRLRPSIVDFFYFE